MQKKGYLALSVSLLFISTACSNNAAEPKSLYHKNGNTINVQNRPDMYNKDKMATNKKNSADFGYVRQQKSPVMGRTISFNETYTIDREKLADAISKMAVTLPDVKDSAVLVTDEEVLIAYQTDVKTEKERSRVADQVKNTAMSFVPRWYHIYVTDDPTLRRNVENLAFMDSRDKNANGSIQETVRLMLKRSPQGTPQMPGENANGEMKNESPDDDTHRIRFDQENKKLDQKAKMGS
jgi:SepF-like predicted cell division protein (DUF552 family)